MPPTIQDVGERALIERLRRRAGAPPAWLRLGIGDDAAVMDAPRGAVEVVTTDSLVEDVHFKRAWSPPRAVGHKALAVNLSDLAAMGAEPRAALLSLALPAALPLDDFDALVDGFLALAGREKVALIGGNLARSPGPLVVDVTAIGAAHPRRVLTRGGGRAGDALYVTGTVGAAAAGLARLSAGLDRAAMLDEQAAACVARYEHPDAQTTIGLQMARNRAVSACVDLSDGLADAARQLSRASGTGVSLDASALPVHPGAAAWAASAGRDPVDFALRGGEDYELLFAVGRRQHRAFRAVAARLRRTTPVTMIGRLTAEPGAWLERSGRHEPLAEGFAHF